VTKGTQVSSCC